MGLLSVLLVRHDCLHEVRDDTNLGVALYNRLGGVVLDDDTRISSAVEVVTEGVHSSDIRLVVVEGNTAYPLHYGGKIPSWSNAEDILVRAVVDLGYTVAKKRKKK